MNLDARKIKVEDRQRKSIKLTPEFIQSVKKHLINPITLRHSDSEPILVAGGRRLAALIEADITNLVEGIHFRFIENLDPTTAKILELEENVKRENLAWRDHITAVGTLHTEYQKRPNWSIEKTGAELNINRVTIGSLIFIYKNLNSPALKDATNIDQAYSILQSIAERRTATIIQDIVQTTNQIFNETPNQTETSNESISPNSDLPSVSSPLADNLSISNPPESLQILPNLNDSITHTPQQPLQLIKHTDFLEWAPSYSGPKFTLIHCDFPYDIQYASYAHSMSSTAEDYDFSGFWLLLDCLSENIDRLASYSSHIMFWFSMKFYCETRKKLESAGLYVHDHPFIWLKSDNSGIIPGRDGIFPRRIYETAFLCTRGRRPLVKSLSNAYAAPTVSNPVHPSQKPEPVLRHFFGMLVDETVDFLDPTCGSGTAVRVADSLNARSVLGLEIDPKYAATANSLTERARTMRRITH